MQTFLDLPGASGAAYRFQRVTDFDQLPAIAGNFIYVRTDGDALAIICCGADETLLHAADQWSKAVAEYGVEALFVRLNVSWRTRSQEHDDICTLHRPPMIVAAEFDRIP